MTLHFASSRLSQLYNSSDLSAGDYRDPDSIVDPGNGRGVQRHADVPTTYIIHAGAQQEASYHLYLWRHQSDGIDIHHWRPNVSHHGTPLSRSDGAQPSATDTSDDDFDKPASIARKVDRDHFEIGQGPFHPDVSGGRSKR